MLIRFGVEKGVYYRSIILFSAVSIQMLFIWLAM
jgi:hypothetical protein